MMNYDAKHEVQESMSPKVILAIIFAVFFAIASGVMIFLLTNVDVKNIGPQGTSIGLATLNGDVRDAIGIQMNLYKLTNYLGYLAIASACIFVLVGFIQLVTKRSFSKIDTRIYILGIYYVVVGVIYVLFEKVVINCRPVIMEGETAPEPSFPSSHTLLAMAVLGSLIIMVKYYIKDNLARFLVRSLCVILMLVIVIGRMLSGVHWFTDIIGSVCISGFLLSVFYAAVASVKHRSIYASNNNISMTIKRDF